MPAMDEMMQTTPFLSLPSRDLMASRVSLIGWLELIVSWS